jgi:hypothetical protein
MDDMFDVPERFRRGPVRRGAALAGGISRDVLEGSQLKRLHEAVGRHA